MATINPEFNGSEPLDLQDVTQNPAPELRTRARALKPAAGAPKPAAGAPKPAAGAPKPRNILLNTFLQHLIP